MYIVTGGAGFIGSNLVHELNGNGITDILIVDNLAQSGKFLNLDGARFTDYMHKDEFRRAISQNSLNTKVSAVFHQGACSNTLVDDGAYMMDNNFAYSKELLSFALRHDSAFVYASTAAVYGLAGPGRFCPVPENEHPLNIYGFSKLTFDNFVRQMFAKEMPKTTVVGLRYFNVYGRRESHKGRMASVIHHFSEQIKSKKQVQLFEGSGGYGNGEQRRDFVFVRDACRLNMFFAQVGKYNATAGRKRTFHTIVNAGSGKARSFNEVVTALEAVHGEARIAYVPLPADLQRRYQHFTEADLANLRAAGCDLQFTPLEAGIRETFATS